MVDRRHFIKTVTTLAAGAAFQSTSHAAKIASGEDRLGKIMTARPLGDTGESLTMLGIGGYHFAANSESESQAIIEAALENGVRFFDNAVQYHNGGAEERYGKLLTPQYRDIVYIMTKTEATTAKEARQELEDSLRRMKTDYLDLWQIHAINSPEDVDERIENGVLDEFLKAKEEGKVRHIGFTGHRNPKAHLRMLERTKDTQPFTTAQMPINLADPSYSSFLKQVVPVLVERKISPLAMKTLAFGNFFNEQTKDQPRAIPDRITLQDALHFVWSQPVTSIITGARTAKELKEKIDLANSFQSLEETKQSELIQKMAEIAGKRMETYKG